MDLISLSIFFVIVAIACNHYYLKSKISTIVSAINSIEGVSNSYIPTNSFFYSNKHELIQLHKFLQRIEVSVGIEEGKNTFFISPSCTNLLKRIERIETQIKTNNTTNN